MDVCVFCKNTEGTLLYETYDIWDNTYALKRCNACRAVYLTPFPSEERLALAYDESYYGCSEKKFKGPFEKALDFFRKNRARRVSKLIPEGGAVLDIGCGNGNFLMQLLNFKKLRLYGSELPGKSAQRAAQNKEINLVTDMLTKNAFASGSMDAITMFHVFEHLTEPAQMLDLVNYFLKPQGYFVVSFPNIGSMQSRIFKGYWLHLDPPRHLFFFNIKDFENFMCARGFILMSKNSCSLEQNPFGFVQSFLNVFLKKREVLFESLKGNKSYTASYSPFQMFLQKLFFVFLFPFAVIGDGIACLFNKGATVQFVFRKK